MGDSKQKKGTWGYWILVAVAFIIVIVALFFNFVKIGKDNALTQAQDKQIGFANIWSSQIRVEIEKAGEYGGMLSKFLEDKSFSQNADSVRNYLSSIVENTSFYRVVLCDGKGVRADSFEASEAFDVSFAEGDNVYGYFYTNDAQCERTGVIAIKVPAKDEGEDYILFCLDLKDVAGKLTESNMEDLSFLTVFKKDGTICGVVDSFADKNSPYLKTGNFLNCVMAGVKVKERYDSFKTKLYNNIGGAIESTYDGDGRTIVCASVGIDDLYIGYGIRQYAIDKQADAYFKGIRSVCIKLGVVIALFTVFVGIVIFVNTIKSKEKGKSLENKADTDMLTELFNKNATERKIEEYISENPNGRALMFILDIDNFKKVNDTMGHAFGDTLLKTLGKEIRMEFRLTDIVGRVGGDEFVIFLKDIKDNLIVEREANRLTRFFHDFKAGGDYVKYSATASIGAAIYPDDARSFKDLYISADDALYRAKKRGKNQLVFFNEEKQENN